MDNGFIKRFNNLQMLNLTHKLSRQNVNTNLTINTILFLTNFNTHALLYIVIAVLQIFYKTEK